MNNTITADTHNIKSEECGEEQRDGDLRSSVSQQLSQPVSGHQTQQQLLVDRDAALEQVCKEIFYQMTVTMYISLNFSKMYVPGTRSRLIQ